jgi:hypothetical protein
VDLIAGVSYIGATDLQAKAWHCVNKYGIFLPNVWAGVNQLKAFALSVVSYLILKTNSEP